ncbi:hypothetical protein E2562_031351 [Oryza meyeriana var. granulata]|uniref:Uncharacterized protein n=1 Tax=Oryza meyeriana var. granulata TaxID=110450 RepID=A0A6G1D8K7_9ORYZ|nr:hypothetical protein E2562_031351 [Oryza meyeriana var. granulata]
MDLWFLTDYETRAWVKEYSIQTELSIPILEYDVKPLLRPSEDKTPTHLCFCCTEESLSTHDSVTANPSLAPWIERLIINGKVDAVHVSIVSAKSMQLRSLMLSETPKSANTGASMTPDQEFFFLSGEDVTGLGLHIHGEDAITGVGFGFMAAFCWRVERNSFKIRGLDNRIITLSQLEEAN